MTSKPFKLPVAFAVLTVLGAGCATPAKRRDVVWPDPPEKPRIRFVQSFRTTEDLEDSMMAKLSRSLTGSDKDTFLDQPMGVALSDDGERLYISDFRAGRVSRVDIRRRKLETFAPAEVFTMPFNVALDGEENVYISDSGSRRIAVYTRNGELLRFIGVGELERPTGLAVDRERGLLYVSDSSRKDSPRHRVLAYGLDGKLVREIGRGRGSGEGQFYFPIYLALDDRGWLYVGDTMNFRIQVFDETGRLQRVFGENGDAPGSFARIKGIAFDGFGNLYVVDAGASVVQMFNRDHQALMWFGGFQPALEYFDIPSCIAIHKPTNRIYVCNEHFARVNAYDLVNTTADEGIEPRPPGTIAAAPPPAR